MALRNQFRTLDFIHEYEKHICLWNTVHPLYRQREHRDAALDAIAMAMGPDSSMTRRDVSTKIRNLRAKFYTEISRVTSGSGPAKSARPDWFVAMYRIMPYVNHNFQMMPTAPEICQNHTLNRNYNHTDVTPPPKRIRFAQQMQIIQTMEHSMLAAVKSLKTIAEQEDGENQMPQNEFEAFGQNVALQLQMLPMSDALKCQEQILSILKQYRLHTPIEDEDLSPFAPTPSPSSADGYHGIFRDTLDHLSLGNQETDLQEDTIDSYYAKYAEPEPEIKPNSTRYIVEDEVNECFPIENESNVNIAESSEKLMNNTVRQENNAGVCYEIIIKCKDENEVVDICSDSD